MCETKSKDVPDYETALPKPRSLRGGRYFERA